MRLCRQVSAAFLLVVASLTPVAHGDVNVPPVVSDHMVLQRDVAAPVWGTAESGEKVVVSIDGQSQETGADAEASCRAVRLGQELALGQPVQQGRTAGIDPPCRRVSRQTITIV